MYLYVAACYDWNLNYISIYSTPTVYSAGI